MVRGEEIQLLAVTEAGVASGVDQGDELVAFAEAIVGTDDAALQVARQTVVDTMGSDAMVDAAAVASNFERMVRIADSTGIPLGSLEEMSAEVREELDLARFQTVP